MTRFPPSWSFVDKNRRLRTRLIISCTLVVPIAALGVGYWLQRQDAGESLDTRPILASVLPRERTLSVPPSSTPVVMAPAPRLPAAVSAALALMGDARDEALRSALGSWAAAEPEKAFVFARSLPEATRFASLCAVLEALGDHPDFALRAGRQLLVEEPARADEYGTIVIGALSRAQQFTTALDLANSTGSEASRTEWTANILGTWMRAEPSAGPKIARVVSREGVPQQVFQSFVEGWAASAPSALADFALTLPAGENRRAVFSTALESWITRDPTVAAEWIGSRLKDAPEFDQALATLLTRTDRVFCPPETAFDWTSGITNPGLRLSTRTNLIKAWAEHDRSAALGYLQTARAVNAQDRGQLVAALSEFPLRSDD